MSKTSIKKFTPEYFRNLVFGAEDSLVSTVGVLFGVASSSSYSQNQILITGLIVIAVEALSMGAGTFLTETETDEYEGTRDKKNSHVTSAAIMFTSYIFFGFLTLLPYLVMPSGQAKYISLTFTLVILFLLGFLPAKNIKSAVRTAVIAGFAVLIGFVVARFFKID